MKLMYTLRGLLFYFLFALSVIVLALLVLLSLPFMSGQGRYEAICRPWAKFCLWLMKVVCGIRIRMKGMENMPTRDSAAVVLVKHQSALDPFWLGAYLSASACFLYKQSLHYIPVFGWVLWAMDMLAVDRGRGRSAFESFMEKGPKKLAQGWWICLFPEGTRVPPGERVRYKTGGARFATKTGTPILPITHNAGHCWPKNSIAKFPGTVTFSVGPLIETKGRSAQDVAVEVENWIENELEVIERENH